MKITDSFTDDHLEMLIDELYIFHVIHVFDSWLKKRKFVEL